MSSTRNRKQGFATRAIHLGYAPSSAQGALTAPIYMTSTYAFETTEDGAAIFRGEKDGYIYGRTRNPTQALLEQRLADLESGEAAVAFASGMAAISATLWSHLRAGDRIVVDRVLYGNTFALMTHGVTRFGVQTDVVDFTDLDAVAEALKTPTRLVFFETPANPNLRVIDIAAVSAMARGAGALTVVDNTFATPLLQRPLELGADLVVHSATKYLSGHGDLLAGVVIGSAALTKEIRLHGLRYMTGATISPLTAFLVMRGLKTLELRVRRHVETAQAVAAVMEKHRAVDRVYYPGLASHPHHALAKRQMDGFGGLIALELKGGFAAGAKFMDALTLASRAVSLGDAETLVQHPASMTHASYSAEERAQHGISEGLIRMSIGLETPEDILDDVQEALDHLI